MISLYHGEIRSFSCLHLAPGQLLKSRDAYIASVLQTGKIVGNSVGETEIWIEDNGQIVQTFPCIVHNSPGRISLLLKKLFRRIIYVEPEKLPLLLNRYNAVPGPIGSLIPLPQNLIKGKKEILIEQNTAAAFSAMCACANKDDVWIAATHGYRSLEDQQRIIEFYIKREGEEQAMRRCAPVGFSEHHSGLALDVGGGFFQEGVLLPDNERAWDWISAHCHKFGFVLKNLPGKEHITGTRPEPWHIRYIGDLSICCYVHQNQLTLDEYLDQICN